MLPLARVIYDTVEVREWFRRKSPKPLSTLNSPLGQGAPTADVRTGQAVSGIRDAVTGGALRARFVMNGAGAPEYYEDDEFAAGGAFSYVVPVAPMEMRVTATGYAGWIMVEPLDSRDPTVRTARTVKEIDVKLRRLP